MTEQVGRYEILDKIGEGGFAIVYRARDVELDRSVALKELRPVLLNDKSWVKRFRREAKTIARLDHPHIVTIHDVYEIDNRLFIVMRLVDGPSLDDLIARRGRLPWPEATEIITAVTEGLDHAHTRGILHRDLKPANILMDPERGPMLTDFGLAKLAGESSMSVTAGGGVVGTPHYIAPEVWEGQGSSKQSDIYALGCILYEMLTGEKIFKGETPPAVMMAHFRPPMLPKVWPEGVPSGVANVLTTALASKPIDRYKAVGEMAKALIALPEATREPEQPEAVDLAVETGDQPDSTDVVPPEQQRADEVGEPMLEQAAESLQETEALLQESLVTAPQQPLPTQAGLPEQPPAREAFPVKFDLQKLEATIADLPPKWRDFLKTVSVSVIIVVMLAFINLFTSSSPWFIWPALGVGILLALRFVNILFGEAEKSRPSSPSTAQSVTPPPSTSTATTTPIPSQAPPEASVSSVAQPVTPLPSTPIPAETPIPGQAIQSTAASLPEATLSTSQAMLARQRRGRAGCLWILAIGGGLILLVIIGVGGFCSTVGGFLENAFPTVELGDMVTEDIRVPRPDSVDTPNLSLKFVGGQFSLNPGAEKALAEGTATYNVAQLKPQITIDGSNVSLRPESDIGFGGFTTEGLENKLDLKLGSAPMALTIDAGGANADIELGGLSLVDLVVSQGAANFNLSFSEPNRVEMKTLKFTGGASNAILAGLANAWTESITFEGGAGNYTLDFSGTLQGDIEVSVKGGLGMITIVVPENVAAQVSVDGGLSNVNTQGAWQKSGDTYILPGEGHEITVEAEIGLGNLELRTP